MNRLSLTDALERGGVAFHVSGEDRYEVLRQALCELSLPAACDRDHLLDQFMAREKAGGTAIGCGIAIPHPRYPVLLADSLPLVRICYLRQPLDYHAADRKPVDMLFLLVCPDRQQYLGLLARLAGVLKSERLRSLLRSQPDVDALLSAVRTAEERYLQGLPAIGPVELST